MSGIVGGGKWIHGSQGQFRRGVCSGTPAKFMGGLIWSTTKRMMVWELSFNIEKGMVKEKEGACELKGACSFTGKEITLMREKL